MFTEVLEANLPRPEIQDLNRLPIKGTFITVSEMSIAASIGNLDTLKRINILAMTHVFLKYENVT